MAGRVSEQTIEQIRERPRADAATTRLVARACKGQRLTPNTKGIVLDALNSAVAESGESFRLQDLFNY